jgi:cytochrome c-type biogenesis protein CcmH
MPKRAFLWIGIIALLILIGATVPRVSAQDGITPTLRPVTDNEVNKISRNLYCPVCQNIPLEVCETAACQDWREQVRDLLAQGYTEQQVREYFIMRFGSKTVGTPTDPVSQFLTIILPFALLGLVGLGIAISLVRWRQNRQYGIVTLAPSVDESHSDDYRARLESELRKRD